MKNGDILSGDGKEPTKADLSRLAELGIDAMTDSGMRIGHETELGNGPIEPVCPPTEIADYEPTIAFGEPSDIDQKPFVEVPVQTKKMARENPTEDGSAVQEKIPKRRKRLDEDEHGADDGYRGLFKRPRHHRPKPSILSEDYPVILAKDGNSDDSDALGAS